MSRPTRREVLAGLATSAAAPATAASLSEPVPAKPNILLIMTDSLSAHNIGCYGNPVIRTPHLDALAGSGVRFRHCFSQHTVCMPTRCSLFTGRYPHVHGVWANGVPLRESEQTIAHHLSAAGYHTWMAGKLHFEPILKRQVPSRGPYFGFQDYLVSDNDLEGPYLDYVRRRFPSLAEQVRTEFALERFSGEVKAPLVPVEAQQTTWIADQTIGYLRSRRGDSRPFFAYASFIDPRQTSYNPPAPFDRMYDPKDVLSPRRKAGELDRKPPYKRIASENLRKNGLLPNETTLRRIYTQYYGAVSFVDHNIGRILKALDEEGIAGNTVVIFTTDHGELVGDHWLRLKGPWMYDLVTHVPMIWRWPGRFVDGTEPAEFAEQVDLLPTLLDLAGAPPSLGAQGRSLRPMLEGKATTGWREAVLTEDRDSSELSAHGLESHHLHLKSIRTRDWRLTHFAGQPFGELFDLRNDPGEYDNLWDDPARRGIREELTARLLDLYVAMDDPLPPRLALY